MDWNDLRYVLATARAGSLAAAARRLGVDPTTVARRLAAAEAALSVRLFDRADGTLRPTPAGEAAVARAARIEAQVEALEAGVTGRDDAVAGTVRLTAVPILVDRLLIPALPVLHGVHPRVRVDFAAEPRNVDLLRREADVALRLSRPERGGSAITRRFGRLDYAAYGPRGVEPDSLPWIGYGEAMSHLPQARWLAAAGGPAAALSVNDAEALLQAVRAGLGRSLLPCVVAETDDALVRLGPVCLSREVWLLTHHELRRQARIRAVVDWLEGLFANPAEGPNS